MGNVSMKFRVKLRRSKKFEVKPEAEQLDGNIYEFTKGWEIEDRVLYKGETAWVPKDKWPDDAPIWIASGDLEEVQ